jgi:hypothetical protein
MFIILHTEVFLMRAAMMTMLIEPCMGMEAQAVKLGALVINLAPK